MREVIKERDKDGNQWLTKEDVKGIIYDLYAAGIVSFSQKPSNFPNKVSLDMMERKL